MKKSDKLKKDPKKKKETKSPGNSKKPKLKPAGGKEKKEPKKFFDWWGRFWWSFGFGRYEVGRF